MKLLSSSCLLLLLFALTGCLDNEQDAAVANGAAQLTKADAEKALVDHTLIGSIPHLKIDFAIYYASGGRLVGVIAGAMDGRDRGAWRVADDGKVCLRWSQWQDGDETCSELWRDGDRYKVFESVAGRMVSVARRERGNVQKLELRTDLELVQAKKPIEAVSAEVLRAMLPGNTITGSVPAMQSAERHAFYAPDNKVFANIPSAVMKDHGTYHITDDGKVCATWSYLQGGHESCERWFKSTKGYLVFDAFDVLRLIGEVRPGNPEKLGG